MSDFKGEIHQIRFRLGLRPRPDWGSLQRSPYPLAGFEKKESNSKGRGGKGREGTRGGRKGRGEKSMHPEAKTKVGATAFVQSFVRA